LCDLTYQAVPLLMRELHVFAVRYFVFAVRNPALGPRGEEVCGALAAAFEAIARVT